MAITLNKTWSRSHFMGNYGVLVEEMMKIKKGLSGFCISMLLTFGAMGISGVVTLGKNRR